MEVPNENQLMTAQGGQGFGAAIPTIRNLL